ncbi:MAG: HEAT repeat domain-containing protein [Deltaproteobacteria bacterium]|nr:HEAT repeat domain-containing protein [Deltaproteobacteria bacterium]
MTVLIAYLTIFLSVFFILFTVVIIFFRRIYMNRKYAALDRARAMHDNAVSLLLSGAVQSASLRKKPGSAEWTVIEGELFKALAKAREGEKPEPGLKVLPHAKDRTNYSDKIAMLFDSLGFTDYYIKKLSSGSRWEKALAADKLGRLKCKRAVPLLISALKSMYKDVRDMAVHSLGIVNDAWCLPHLMERLKKTALEEEDFSYRIIKSSLISFGPEAADALIKELNDPLWQVRAAAADILAELNEQGAAPTLRAALADHEHDVRAKAAKALGRLKDAASVDALISLLSDEKWLVRLHAARALGLIKSLKALRPLAALLKDRNWQVRCASAEALSRTGAAGYRLLLEEYLLGRDTFSRDQAGDEIERTGFMKALAIKLLNERQASLAGTDGVSNIRDWRGDEVKAFAEVFRSDEFPEILVFLKGFGRERLMEVLGLNDGKGLATEDIEAAAGLIADYEAPAGYGAAEQS